MNKKKHNICLIICFTVIIIVLIVYLLIMGKGKFNNKDNVEDENTSMYDQSTLTYEDKSKHQNTNSSTEKLGLELTTQEKKQYILNHPEEYTDELIEFMNKYDEVINYVYSYKDISYTSISANSFEYTTETSIPLFIQWDQSWGYQSYGDSLVGVSGCGPTSLAMVYVGITGKSDQTPATICDMSQLKGYYVSGVGTSWDLMTEGAKHLGLKSQELPLYKGKLIDEIEKGNPIICSMRKGDFTEGGHFIVITGYKDGKFIVNDPNSIKNSSVLWEYSVLEPQIRNLWAFYQ